MATQVTYSGNGSQLQFDITFPYDSPDQVHVYVAGASSTFSWVTSTRIELPTAPASGVEVLIRRITDINSPVVDFADGAVLTSDDLDKTVNQLLHHAQETEDRGTDMEERAIRVRSGEVAPPMDPISTFAGKALGISGDGTRVVPVPADALAAEEAAAQTAADRVQTGLDRVATGADRVQTGLDRTAASTSASAAAASATSAATGAAVASVYPYTAPPAVPAGVASGSPYWMQSQDNKYLLRYTNAAGVATPVAGVGPIPLESYGSYPNGTMQRWLNLATAAGSSGASATVQAALRNFEHHLRQADLVKYFIRLNVFLGNDATAARTPFIQRPGVGFSLDTGTISSWTEANGMSNVVLDTGATLATAGLDVYNTLLGVYNLVDPNGSGSGYLLGNASQAWGLYPDTTGNPSTTSALLLAWDYAGRIIGGTHRATTGPVKSGSITKGPMSGYRARDGSGAVVLCGYPLVDANNPNRPAYYSPTTTIAEPSGNIQLNASSTWPVGGYWIADAMPPDKLSLFHRIFHMLQVAVGRGVITEGY